MSDLEDFALRFTQAAVHFLWIGALVGLGVFVVERLFLRSSASRHTWYLLGMLLMAAVFPVCLLVTSSIDKDGLVASASLVESVSNDASEPLGGSRKKGNETSFSPATEAGAMVDFPRSPDPPVKEEVRYWAFLAPWVMGLYLIGILIMLLRLSLGWWGTSGLRKRGEPVKQSDWVQTLDRVSGMLNLKVRPLLRWSEEVASPVVIGLVKPVILFPISLATRLSPSQVEAVLAHELAHLRRKDPWTLLIQRVVETLLFFHPLVWWMSRQLEKAREEACDDRVVAVGCDPADYAEALLICSELRAEASKRSPSYAMQLAATGKDKAPLRGRVLRLLGQNQNTAIRLGRAGWLTGLLVLCGVTLMAVAGRGEGGDAANLNKDLKGADLREVSELVLRAEKSDEEAIAELVAMGPRVAPEMGRLFAKGGMSDGVGTRVLSELVSNASVQEMLVDLLQDPQSDPNTIHCSLVVLGKSGNPSHVDLIARFLKSKDIAAMPALAELGGAEARDHLIAAFDAVPTERWWLLAQSVGGPWRPGGSSGAEASFGTGGVAAQRTFSQCDGVFIHECNFNAH